MPKAVIIFYCKCGNDIHLTHCYQKEGTEKEVSPRNIVQSILDDEDLLFY